ncbi:mandelate racemase/muconate lactonizing enzyme family protein [Alicyclobacillus tolerans]|uniref:mandelate racemase/muconate lactonizing enzyme family protein n=1 Tax=Alicyclobacillus tolerans TaxID=90970 RepID=UPI0027DED002|nr:mandelate racemase/muconate lactonizing enzyme family protein [Alicyclobacillus tolerans]MCF8565605.1 mandelate racemase/muconate lactonizing enzyme family protein [Alicyclobacillus tolerans]
MGNGFSVLKCTPFDEVTETSGIADLSMGIERLEAMAQVVPMHQIAVDCHERFNLQTLEHLLTRLSERSLIPYWVEDSLHQVYTSELPSLGSKYPQFVFGAGETSLNLHELLGVGSHCGIDILMPDVKHFGGVTAVKAAILSLEERGHRVTLHNPTGPIGTAFSAHLCTLRRDSVPLEFPWAVVSDRDHSTIPAEPVSSGAYVLSDLPGIGLDPNPDYMVEYGQKWTVSGWAK